MKIFSFFHTLAAPLVSYTNLLLRWQRIFLTKCFKFYTGLPKNVMLNHSTVGKNVMQYLNPLNSNNQAASGRLTNFYINDQKI